MNMQALMKQAQSMQKEMMKSKEEIDNTTFLEENEMVKLTINGKKEILSVEIINKNDFEMDDLDMLEDLLVVALNKANQQVDALTEKKMGKFSSMPGMF